MEVKGKKIELVVGVTKKVPDIAVIMGFAFNANKHCLGKLSCDSKCELYKGAEHAALGYALFETIRDKFVGSPLEMSRSRVSSVSCNSIDGQFLISWNTQGSLSMMRKTTGLALSALNPIKLYSKYAENMKLMGGKADRSVFNSCVSDMVAGIKKGVKIVVVGKIKTTPAKLKEMVGKIEKKQPNADTPASKDCTKPPKHDDHKCEYPTIKASGIAAAATAFYIRTKSGGMSVSVCDNSSGGVIVIYNQSWKTKQKALKESNRVKDFVRQKFEKLKSEFAPVFAYLCITQEVANCCTVSKIIKTKPSASSMSGLISKIL